MSVFFIMMESKQSVLLETEMRESNPSMSEPRPIRYTFLAGDFAPMPGGTSTFMYNLIAALPPESVRVIAVPTKGSTTFDAHQPFQIDRVSTPPRWNHASSRLKYLVPDFLRRLFQGPQPDLVICCHGRFWLLAIARIHQQITGVPYAVFLHGSDIIDARRRRSASLYDNLLQGAEVVFPNSRLTEAVAKNAGVKSARMTSIHPCLDIQKLEYQNETPDIDIDLTGKHVILSVARLVSNKGIDLILKAMPAILRNMSNVHYMIVGDGPERPALEAMAVDLNIADQVTFAGHQPYESISAYYYASDIFVLTPRELQSGVSESFGVAYLEANMLGLPVVATNVGGVADAVVDKETGLLVDSENPDEIAAAIIRLLKDPVLATRLAHQGRQRVLKEFTCETTADKFINAVKQIV